MFRMMTSATVPMNERASWFVLNTYLQKYCSADVSLDIPRGFAEYYEYLEEESIDLVYATAHDAKMLIKEKGFVPVASPLNIRDEAVIASKKGSPFREIYDLKPGCRIGVSEDKDINLLGMLLIEPANLSDENVEIVHYDNWTLIANAINKGEVDIGFFLQKSYDCFSADTLDGLNALVRSEIGVIHHCLMAKEEVLASMPHLQDFFITLHEYPYGQDVLRKLGITRWTKTSMGQMNFLMDIMQTLH